MKRGETAAPVHGVVDRRKAAPDVVTGARRNAASRILPCRASMPFVAAGRVSMRVGMRACRGRSDWGAYEAHERKKRQQVVAMGERLRIAARLEAASGNSRNSLRCSQRCGRL
ncbi:hypothetical protein Bcep1808_4750 [Burkholderia vietnamiensis G4]|uniref:Uncharacterized protein n=1 Tax=Burkholderia vietnamiensis (strain G4 / LMG 22486) TaxID=269482 RepID=A4JN54_BURVG|nr:hypothetical protein Bcep1808_4750 [Burkholderia vietnamiensis G4]